MEDEGRRIAEKKAASRRATDAQVLEDAERLIAVWNERQIGRMPMLFSATIGAVIAAQYWFLWIRCPACPINAIDLRTLDRHRGAAVLTAGQLINAASQMLFRAAATACRAISITARRWPCGAGRDGVGLTVARGPFHFCA
jgi:hypothetical protein